MSKRVLDQADYVFMRRPIGLYSCIKDRYGYLQMVPVFTQKSIDDFLKNKSYKVVIVDMGGIILERNFTDESAMQLVEKLLLEVQLEYDNKLRMIDKALDEGNEEEFHRLAEDLYGGLA